MSPRPQRAPAQADRIEHVVRDAIPIQRSEFAACGRGRGISPPVTFSRRSTDALDAESEWPYTLLRSAAASREERRRAHRPVWQLPERRVA
jgi:hypothetical protein